MKGLLRFDGKEKIAEAGFVACYLLDVAFDIAEKRIF